MGLALPPGVTCCRTGGFTFFLDIDRDRYFAIGGEADALFSLLLDGHLPADDAHELVRKLAKDGLIVETSDKTTMRPCEYFGTAFDSALDLPHRETSAFSGTRAFGQILSTRMSLRWGGLGNTLRRLATRKTRLSRPQGSEVACAAIATAFERCNAVSSPLDQCLPRSIAVAHRLLDQYAAPTLLIGVRAQPFAAHCWVESGGLIVNDRHDTVRAFAPILVL